MTEKMKNKRKKRIKNKAILLISIFLAIAILNWIILRAFGQNSSDRTIHSLFGLFLLVIFFSCWSFSNIKKTKLLLLLSAAIIPCYLGTILPDFDIYLLGIGGHRNPLFHSGLTYFYLYFLTRKKQVILIHIIISGFGIGIASHLLWDLLQYADVRWIPGKFFDQLWLGTNALFCLLLIFIQTVPRFSHTKNII